MSKNFFYLFFLLQSLFVVAQKMDTADYVQRKAFLVDYASINKNHEAYIKTKYSSDIAKDIIKNYLEFQKNFRDEVKEKNFYTKSIFNIYIEGLVQKLRSKNPTIPAQIKVLVAKDNVPNAYTSGDGILVVNMGLFNWVDNEEQLLAILGHEIAHNLLNHTLVWQSKVLNANKNSKNKVSEISKSKNGKTEKAFQLFRDLAYKNSIEKRKYEIQADSLGYIIYKNQNTKTKEYIKALKNLEEFDTISPTVVQKETYKKLFDLPGAPFQEKWMKMEDFSNYNYSNFKEKLNKDSISTHPLIVDRLKFLQTKFPELKDANAKAEEPSEAFKDLKTIAKNEIHTNFFHSENYGHGIYVAMQFLQDNEDTNNQYQWLGKYFEKIVEGRKNYKLNRYLDKLDPKNQSESYQQFLSFIWNLNISELQKIADYYNKKSS